MTSELRGVVVLRVGVEGGSLSVIKLTDAHGASQFDVRLSEMDYDEEGLEPVDRSIGLVDKMEEAFAVLDAYPWHRFFLVELAAEHELMVLDAVASRGGEESTDRWRHRLRSIR